MDAFVVYCSSGDGLRGTTVVGGFSDLLVIN